MKIDGPTVKNTTVTDTLNQPQGESMANSTGDERARVETMPSPGSSVGEILSESEGASSRSTRDMSPGEITAIRRDDIVNQLSVQLKNWLNEKFQAWANFRTQNSSHSDSKSSNSEVAPRITDTGTQRVNKRQRQGLDDEDDEGGDEDNEDIQRRQKRPREQVDSALRFACPFLKNNQGRYRRPEWSCCWPGWPTVHRMKQHLYRRHLLPKYRCNRCCEDLKSAELLSQHQRLPIPCELQTQEFQVGIDEQMERRLRMRGESKRGRISEKEKWVEVFKILFPDIDAVPSPYQTLLVGLGADTQYQDGTILERFEEFSNQEFARRVRPQIEALVDRAVEQTVTPEALTLIFGNVLRGMFETFRKSTRESDTGPGAKERIDCPVEVPRQGASQAESNPFQPCHKEGVNLLDQELQWLGSLIDGAPSQEFDFDFDDFFAPLR
ncbi:hypothetical protein BGZ63DRAFT_396198 [Mariannaea sp. PMI_226]|nr:hypothetical protein BGZ63DRAFT_396198 [Mariannaea sp. PMI_226]